MLGSKPIGKKRDQFPVKHGLINIDNSSVRLCILLFHEFSPYKEINISCKEDMAPSSNLLNSKLYKS